MSHDGLHLFHRQVAGWWLVVGCKVGCNASAKVTIFAPRLGF